MVSKSMSVKWMDHTVEDTWKDAFDIDETSGVDAMFSSPDREAARAKAIFDRSFAQWKDDKIAAKALESNNWIVPAAAEISLAAAVTAGDTTFDISDAEKASSSIAAGDLIKIGDERKWGTASGEVEYLDVAIVKTVGADGSGTGATDSLITISSTAAELPTSMSMFGDTFKNGLRLALRAHDSGARLQIDKPVALTGDNVDNTIHGIRTRASRAYIFGKKLTLFITPEVYEVIQGISASGAFSPMAANDLLGKEVIAEGDFAMVRGMKVISNANALGREGGISDAALTKPIHYIWAFEEGETFGYGLRFQNSKLQDVQGSPILQQHLEYKICGFTMLYTGSQKSFLLPVTV